MAGKSTAVAKRSAATTGTEKRAHIRKKPFYPSWLAKFIGVDCLGLCTFLACPHDRKLEDVQIRTSLVNSISARAIQ